jgi:hypothetical protein
VLIALPSYSVSESLLSHYGNRIASLEHRYLNAISVAGRITSCDMLYISTVRPAPEVFDYYLSLLPGDRRRRPEAASGSWRSMTARRAPWQPSWSSSRS